VIASFFGGVIVGAAMILLALFLATRSKTPDKPQHNEISAVGVK
jgi:hypothetical protein